MEPATKYLLYLFAVLVCFVYIHETAHAVIFEEYGCTYTMGVEWGGAYTEGHCPHISEARSLSLDEVQAGVENFGYQLMLPTLFLAGIFIVLLDLRFRWSEK